jgi:hypothetical protein
MTPFERACDACTRLGFSIIPIGEDKKPLIEWKRYQTEKATLEQLHQWQDHFHPSAWAAVTGAISGIFVLDFDGKQGRSTMLQWKLEPHVRTAGGGFHVYFKYPGRHVPNAQDLRNEVTGEQWKGVDVRGDGGYAIHTGETSKGTYTQEREVEV